MRTAKSHTNLNTNVQPRKSEQIAPSLKAGDGTMVPPPATPHHNLALRRVIESSPAVFRTPYSPRPPLGSLKRFYDGPRPAGGTPSEGPAPSSLPFFPPSSPSPAVTQTAPRPGISASRHAGSQGPNPAGSAAAAADQLIADFMQRHNDTATICTTMARSVDAAIASLPERMRAEAQGWRDCFLDYAKEAMMGIRAPLRNPTPAPTAPSGIHFGNNSQRSYANVAAAGGPPQTGNPPPARTKTTTNPAPPRSGPTGNLQGNPRRPARPPREDLRVLVRVSEEKTDWARQQTGYGVRKAIAAALELPLADLPEAHGIPTGFSIRAKSATVQSLLLERREEIGRTLNAIRVEKHVPWYNYAFGGCPSTMLVVGSGMLPVTKDMIEEEVVSQIGVTPVNIRESLAGPDAQGRHTWIVSFLEQVPKFRLFGVTHYARLVKKNPPVIRHDPGCQGYHAARTCARYARCERCGKTLNDQHAVPCILPEQCANCFGPFPASHEGCPAKPRRIDGRICHLSKRELAAIRRVGAGNWKTVQDQNQGSQEAQATKDTIIPATNYSGPATTPLRPATRKKRRIPRSDDEEASTTSENSQPPPEGDLEMRDDPDTIEVLGPDTESPSPSPQPRTRRPAAADQRKHRRVLHGKPDYISTQFNNDINAATEEVW